ncbi:Nardilysin, partial [Trachymyrmex septentrionalis]
SSKFRAIRLPNGLEALLISDKYLTSTSRKKKAACSLCVNVGNFSNLPQFPNISYFLALGYRFFQIPEKCSEQRITFEKFIQDHHGTTDFSIENEHTRYYFDIEENNLFLALHNFRLFFINPILPKHRFIEQLNAIKTAFQMGTVFNGKSKYEQLFFSFAQTGHPANMFSVDDFKKFWNSIDYEKLYNVLDTFKKRHYSAHRMKLAIRSGLSLDAMEKFVKASFARVPNNRMPPDNFSKFKNDLPFDTSAFRRILYNIKIYINKLSFLQLQITWALPSFSDYYKCNSYQYIPLIIGYKGKGSLIKYLQKKTWSSTLDNNMSVMYCKIQPNSLYTLLRLTMTLTFEGRKHLENVLDAIFSFINLLKTVDQQKEIYNDIIKIKQNIFRYADYDEIGIFEVKQLSMNMHFYPPKAYITINQFDSNYNAQVIQKCLNYLAPEMANIMIFSNFSSSELNKVEPWWQTAYTDIEIPKEWIERWKIIEPLPEFHLPLPNIFLANNSYLLKTPNETIEKYPVKLYSNSMSELWYRPDFKRCLPKCYMHFYFISPLKLQSSKNEALMDMYCILLEQLLADELYPALQVGFKYNISVNTNGFTLKISGLNETLPLLAALFAHNMVEYSSLITKNIFESAKIRRIQTYYDLINIPDCFISDVASSIQNFVHHSLIDMHTALQDITLENFQDFVKSFTERLYIQCLVQGNMTSTVAIKTLQQYIKTINCRPLHSDTIQLRSTQIPLGTSYYKIKNINKVDTISMVSNYYQTGINTIELSTLIHLIIYIMKFKLCEVLPTEKFGSTTVDVTDVNGILGYFITIRVRADRYTTEYIDKRIDQFLRWFKNVLEMFTEKELDVYKEMFLKSKSHDLNHKANLEDEVERNWEVIVKCTYIFDFHEQEILALKKINVNKLKEWSADHISDESNFRKLSLHIVKSQKEAEYVHLEHINDDYQQYKPNHYIKNHYITNVEDYKKKLVIFPTKRSNKSF